MEQFDEDGFGYDVVVGMHVLVVGVYVLVPGLCQEMGCVGDRAGARRSFGVGD